MIKSLSRVCGFFFALSLAFSASAQQNLNGTVAPFQSQAFTATTLNSSTYTNTNCKGAHFIVNLSSYTSGNVTVHIQGQDPVSASWYDILVSPAISSTTGSPYIMKVYPGATILANYSTSDFLPYTWRVQLVGASTPSMTLSVGANCEY